MPSCDEDSPLHWLDLTTIFSEFGPNLGDTTTSDNVQLKWLNIINNGWNDVADVIIVDFDILVSREYSQASSDPDCQEI